MLVYIYLGIKMEYHLNYSNEDLNYEFLWGEYLKLSPRKLGVIMALKGVESISMVVLLIKIIFTSIFF